MTGTELVRSDDGVTYDPEANAYYAVHDWSSEGSLSVTVVSALSEIDDTDPREMEPLDSYVDPDALDGLFEPRTGNPRDDSGRLELVVDDYHVTIYADGEIVVRP
ncbi:HalOD1 output domain-containing protein [Halostella litorea]|uniref:HalOD1 output domain-containing protein n=1 Tax=Halostella litorea TaxID=2528831 RepID=UPI00138712BA|nr:HalOD1 output domain-containing protein [Halostella litorea]